MKIFILACLVGAVSGANVQAQKRSGDYNDRPIGSFASQNYNSRDSMVCVWPKVGLRDAPGTTGRYIATIYFGETVRRISDREERFEGKNYIEVQAKGGYIGWVQDYLFVQEGGIVTLLGDKPIHKSPSMSTPTSDYFYAGELLVLSDYQGNNWVELTSSEKQRVGWIKGIDEVSVSESDIRIAALYQDALQQKDIKTRRKKLEEIRKIPGFVGSPLEQIIVQALNLSTAQGGYVVSDPKSSELIYADDGQGNIYTDGGTNNSSTKTPTKDKVEENPTVVLEKVIDMETGKYYNRITERGKIIEVEGLKNPKTIYWCYHKTRPVGSKVLLHLPEGGFVQLEVVAALKKTNPAAIGLGRKLLESVYGTRFAKEAIFSYPQ